MIRFQRLLINWANVAVEICPQASTNENIFSLNLSFEET